MPRKRTRAERGSRPPKVTRKGNRWRAQIYDPLANDGVGSYISVCRVLRIPTQTFATQREAWQFVERAEALLTKAAQGATIAQIRERWLAHAKSPKGRPWKEATSLTNSERTAVLAQKFGSEQPHLIEEELLAYCREHMGPSQREASKAMLSFAVRHRLCSKSPLRDLAVEKGGGNKDVDPPTERDLKKLLQSGRQICPPLADWIEFGSLVGTRPGETDALRLSDFNADYTRVQILRQLNAKTGKIDTPKKIHTHWIAVPPRAREIVKARALLLGPDDYVFANVRDRTMWTKSSRAYHWNAIMAMAGFRRRDEFGKLTSDFTPYLATRHYCGWQLVNIVGATEAETAIQLRHDDGGILVRQLYGQRDRTMAIDRIALLQQDEQAVAA